MERNEAIHKLAKGALISLAHAEDIYDSFFPKPVVPQCVADWYEEHKYNLISDIYHIIRFWDKEDRTSDFYKWFDDTKNEAIKTLVNMHQFGYEARKDKKYIVKFNNLRDNASYLKKDLKYQEYYTGGTHVNYSIMLEHTREELEMNGLGWVFDCPGVEVKEVE